MIVDAETKFTFIISLSVSQSTLRMGKILRMPAEWMKPSMPMAFSLMKSQKILSQAPGFSQIIVQESSAGQDRRTALRVSSRR